MKVAECMTSAVVRIEATEGVPKALSLMTEHHFRHLPVIDRRRLVGVVSERDLLEATGWDPERSLDAVEGRTVAVRDIMSVPLKTAEPTEDVCVAATRLVHHGIGCLPVVEEDQLAGMLTETDVIAAFVRAARAVVLTGGLDPELKTCTTTNLATVDTGVSVASALAFCRKERVRHLPVLHDGWFVGLVSDRDLLLWVGKGRGDATSVEEVMSKYVVSLGPTARLSEAAARMLDEKIACVAVMSEDKKLQGLVTTRDVLERGTVAIPAIGRSGG